MKTELEWWKAITSKDDSSLKTFSKILNAHNTFKQDEQFDQLIYQSYELRLSAIQHNEFKAFLNYLSIKKCIRKLELNKHVYSDDVRKLMQLYICLFEYGTSNSFPFLNSIKKENVKKNQLIIIESLSKDTNLVVKTLGTYFLGKIYLEIEKNPTKAAQHFSFLTSCYPNNITFKEQLLKCKKNDIIKTLEL